MKYLIPAAFVALTALPAQAFDRMLRSDCQVTVQKIDELFHDLSGGMNDNQLGKLLQSIRVTPQGWCQMRGGDQGLEDAEFDSFEWRAEGITRWTRDGIPPLALELRVTGLDPDDMQAVENTNRPPVSVHAVIRQLPETGQLIVERAVMENEAGDSLAVSGVFERVFLSSPSMMQTSVGSVTFKAALMTMTLDGTHENPFGFNVEVEMRGVPEAQRQAAFDAISSMPDGLMDDASRAELTAFSGDLPKPVGTLEVSVNSERGLGLMQIGMSAYRSFESSFDENAQGNQFDILFDGLTVEANWSPAAQVAD